MSDNERSAEHWRNVRQVIRERDGSETVYRTLQEAQRAELERCPHPMIAKKNVRDTLVRGGLVPGTPQAQRAAALDEHVSLSPLLPSSATHGAL